MKQGELGIGISVDWNYRITNPQPMIRILKPAHLPSAESIILTVPVIAGEDDAQEQNSVLDTTSTAISIGAVDSIVGLRFRGVNLPSDAQIEAAYLEVFATQTQTGNMSAEIGIEMNTDATAFSSSTLPSSRILNALRMPISVTQEWSANSWARLTDVSALLQSVIDPPGWNLGQSVVLTINPHRYAPYVEGVLYTFPSYESNPALAARLVIYYRNPEAPSPTPTATFTPTPTATPTNTPTQTPI
jgi:hypothetical protein